MLAMGSTGHGRGSVSSSQSCKNPLNQLQLAEKDGRGILDLQHHSSVHDVLGGGSPVDIFPAGFPADLLQAPDQRHDGMNRTVGGFLELVEVEVSTLALADISRAASLGIIPTLA